MTKKAPKRKATSTKTSAKKKKSKSNDSDEESENSEEEEDEDNEEFDEDEEEDESMDTVSPISSTTPDRVLSPHNLPSIVEHKIQRQKNKESSV